MAYVHNPEINWETEEVRMTRCSPLCRQIPEKKVIKKRQSMKKDKSDLKWTMEERKRREEITDNYRQVEELVA